MYLLLTGLLGLQNGNVLPAAVGIFLPGSYSMNDIKAPPQAIDELRTFASAPNQASRFSHHADQWVVKLNRHEESGVISEVWSIIHSLGRDLRKSSIKHAFMSLVMLADRRQRRLEQRDPHRDQLRTEDGWRANAPQSK
ncbi:hypothetical protein OE88DRAFT_1645648 [Heliocybe sulcata]|uniref:Uncharacterized protein n=1 Tax=Heliocybe sulcata TaxID=5364 RepID=A0A5C3N0F8_9AGAM|nr:hypothetical protein OE88DRAFT_1645648 [Heliocybe sulcata]